MQLPSKLSAIGTLVNSSTASFGQLGRALSIVGIEQATNYISLSKLNGAQVAAILNSSALSKEKRIEFIEMWKAAKATSADAAANTADAAAKGVNEAATWSLTKATKGLWAVLKAHPLLLVVAGIAAVISAWKIADNWFTITLDAQRKKTQKLTDEYNTLAQEVQSLEGELGTIKQRIQEINALDNPTFTDDQELKRLEKQVELLERERDLKKEAAQEKAEATNKSVQSEYDRQYKTVGDLIGANTYHSIYDFVDYDARGQKVKVGKAISGEQYYEELIRKVKELNDLRDNTNADDWVGSADERALADYAAKLQNMSTEFSALATKVQITDDASIALYNSLADMADMGEAVANGDYWSFLLHKAGKDNIQYKANELKGLSDALAVADTTEKTAQATQKLQDIISQDAGLGNMISQAEGLGYAAKGSLSALTAWDGTIEGMTPEVTDAANAIGQLIIRLFEVGGVSTDGATPAVNSLKEALAGLSDETTVLRSALEKLGDSEFMDWLQGADGKWENLKSLLDKFPNLRDELEAYASAVAAGEDPQKAFVALQRAMNASMADFNTDQVYNGVNDVIDACNSYGAGSNQVLQAVQNLQAYIPGLVNYLYDESGALDATKISALGSEDALYRACAAAIEMEKRAKNADISNLIDQLNDLASTAVIGSAGIKAMEDRIIGKQTDAVAEYNASMSALEAARNRWSRSSSSKKTSSKKEIYVPDVDPLYQYLQTVEDINDDLDGLDIDEKLLDEDDFEGKNALIEARIKKLEELKAALHELNNARDVEIATAVDKLNGYGGFQATYDAESGKALINNMDALKGLTGDTAKAAEELIDYIESGSKAAISSSHEYMEALVEQNNLLKEQKELREDIADDRIERLKNQISLSENQQEVLDGGLNRQGSVQKLKEQIGWLEEIQAEAHKTANDIRAEHPGIKDDDPLLQKWIQEYWDAADQIKAKRREIADATLAPIDEFIEKADEFNWWDNIDTTKVEMLAKQLETVNQLLEDGYLTAEQFKERNDRYAKEMYQAQKDALDTIIDKTKEMIKLEVEKRVEALESEVDDHEKITNSIKERLAALREENNYNKSVAQKTKEIAEIQQKINTLSLSNDRRDIAERKKLEEELAGLQSDLADTQADHVYDAQVDALDKSHEAFEQSKQDEIKAVKATIDTEGKLYEAAIRRIDAGWDQLYKDLININDLYQNGIDGEDSITSAWNNATAALQKYQGVLQAKQGIEKEYVTNIGNSNRVVNSQVNDPSATSHSVGSKATDRYGMTVDQQEDLNAIVSEMQENSLRWHTADENGKRDLEKANQNKVAEAQSILAKSSDGKPHKLVLGDDGWWYIDKVGGDKFYEKYHTGTKAVGSNEPWDLKSDEIIAKLQREEAVIPKDQVQPTLRLLEWGNTLASKASGLFSGGGLVSSSMSDTIKGAPLSPASGAIVNNNAPSFAPKIQVEVKYDSSASPADAKRFGENITAGIVEAFHRKGIGTGAKPLGVTI